MTVNDLIATLEQFDGEAPVFLAMQPSWPFEYSIGDVVAVQVGIPDEGDRIVWEDEDGEHEGALMEARTNGTLDVGIESEDGGVKVFNIRLSDVTNIDEPTTTVYLAERSQTRYLPSEVAYELDWGR